MSFADKVPPLKAYIERIGAEELNFRRYMIKDYRAGSHYYRERTLIKVADDGEITVTGHEKKENSPTAEEAEAIKSAWVSTKEVPRSIHASRAKVADLKAKLIGSSEGFFEFVDRARDGAIMVQQHFRNKEGRKVYVAWSLWSDGEWRKMEPDGALPFWKPRKAHARARKMIHEGAKVAAFIDGLVNDPERKDELARHPWGKELELYEHWGMIGGALAPHRADYDELRRDPPKELVYVCDRDHPGESALQEVSRSCRLPLKGIMFGEKFPETFDMADPMPEELFSKTGRWVGPTLRGLMMAATWATEKKANPEGKGKTIVVLRDHFREEWMHSVAPEVFIHKDWPNQLLMKDEFNSMVRPFSDVDDTARLIKSDAASKGLSLKYSPSERAGFQPASKTGNRAINTHCPTTIKEEKGDVKPFLDFMEHLIVDEKDRKEMLRWCATLIARPDIKMSYGVLLISEAQGVGKSTLGSAILAPLVGEDNVSEPSEQTIVDSAYNYWVAHKRLAVIHEIYAGHSSKAYNKLKNYITETSITVSKKYLADYKIDNWAHFFACSNSVRAMKLDNADRRWFVPQVTEEIRDTTYWTAFRRWLDEEGGLGIIKAWAGKWLKKEEPVMQGAPAPSSAMKREVVEEGYSPGMKIVVNVLDNIDEIVNTNNIFNNDEIRKEWEERNALMNGGVVLTDNLLRDLVSHQLYEGRQNDRLESPLTIRKLARERGFFVGKEKISPGLAKVVGKLHTGARIISNKAEVAEARPIDLLSSKIPTERRRTILPLEWLKLM